MNEFQLINFLSKGLKKEKNTIIKSIGDDTAVVKYRKDANAYILLTTDSLVENIHFQLDYHINKEKLWYFSGWKLLAINISDIFAMGGEPSEALVSLHIPAKVKNRSLKLFYSGLDDCANNYNIRIVGGNISGSGHDLIITLFLTGTVDKKNLLLREGAKTGDYIYVQKGIGNAKAGLELLKAGYTKLNSLVLSHLKPVPSNCFKNLQKKYRINSAIDISDGLLGDLGHILQNSKKGADIYINNIQAGKSIINLFPDNYLEYILYGGEDYKMIFTSPDKIKNNDSYPIGRINKKKGLFLVHKDKKIKLKNPQGYVHF